MPKKPYNIPRNHLFSYFRTSKDGLSEDAVTALQQKFGKNDITKEKPLNIFKLLIKQVADPLVIILLVALIVSVFLGELKDAFVIGAIVFLNGVIGFVQEFKAIKRIKALKKMIELNTRVIRDGKQIEIDSKMLVPGDIVVMQAGDKVPADVRLYESKDAYFDEALLTGESLPVAKESRTIHQEEAEYSEQKNMAFAGSLMVRGYATAVVTDIGLSTAIGKITRAVESVEQERLPVQIKISRFALIIGFISVIGSVSVFVLGLMIGLPIAQIFRDMVAVLVASVPEGLPIVVTVTLAIGVSRMARANAIIRNLPAVETLGSTTVIGTDKTGTLTKNEMTVKRLFADGKTYEVTGDGYSLSGMIRRKNKIARVSYGSDLYWTLLIGVLTNDSDLLFEDDRVDVVGDPTEGALYVSAAKAGITREKALHQYKRIDQIPFDSSRAYMASLYHRDDEYYIFAKGSPETLLEFCDDVDNREIKKQVAQLSSKGLRVLAMIRKPINPQKSLQEKDMKNGFVFCGLQAMMDPPRREVIETIKECKSAGIRVVMITGDHAITAAAIGKEVGILETKEEVVTGKELVQISDEELMKLSRRASVYARVSPEDKLRIVEALKKNGEIVAVTGDGVNDAPALKAGHIGVAMGRTGTDVAKESADMVIVDDNFTSIVRAVEQGRIVFENIRRVALYLVPTGIAAIITVLITMLLGLPIPYTPIQLLWINLVASGLQDIALAFEPGDGDELKRPPIRQEEGIMSRMMIRRTFLVGGVISLGVLGIYWWALQSGMSLENARTLALTTTVLFQFFQVWNARSEYKSIFQMKIMSNPFLFYTLAVAVIAQLLVLYAPAMQDLFETYPIDLLEWGIIFAIASIVLVVVELDKFLSRTNIKEI